jgi:hypothetical protein
MSDPGFRALCKDLVEDLDAWMEYGHSPANLPLQERCTLQLIKRARAALAAEDEPSDRIHEIAVNLREDAFSWEADARLVGNISAKDIADLCDVTIARYGTPAPVPVTEPRQRPIWTEGICGDGAALLKDGVMMPIEEVVAELNLGAAAIARIDEFVSLAVQWDQA